jgi:hypothetical protein
MVRLNMNRPGKSFLYPSSEKCLTTGFIASNADNLAISITRKNILQPVADFSRYVCIMTGFLKDASRSIVALIRLKLQSKQVDIRRKTCGFEFLLPYLIGECLFKAPNLLHLHSVIGAKFKRR